MTTQQPSTTELITQELEARGGLLSGHFRLSSGRHSERFIQKFRLLEEPGLVAKAVTALRAQLGPVEPTVIVSAAVGGIVLGYEMARQYGCKAIFVEKDGGLPTLRRGFELTADDRVIVVEDVVTTGGSIKEVLEIVRAAGATVEAVAIIIARAQVDFGTRSVSLLFMPIASFAADACPLCDAKVPLADPGSRRLSR